MTGGNNTLSHGSDADLRPDIAHVRFGDHEQLVYEIKPEGDVHLAKGKEKLAKYIGALNVGMVKTSKVFVSGPEYSGELWIMFKRGRLIWRVTWRTTAPGVLQYKWDRPNTKAGEEDAQLREEAWRQAMREGRWTDISRQEMQDNAEELYVTVETMVGSRDVLKLFRDGVTLLVEGVGATAEAILSVRLWNHIDNAPRIIPIIRVPAPQKLPMVVPPKPAPPINARSLWSDKRMAPKIAPSPKPGKSPTNVSPN